MKKLIATWVDEQFLDELDFLANNLRMSRSELMRMALEKVVSQQPVFPALLQARRPNPNKGERAP